MELYDKSDPTVEQKDINLSVADDEGLTVKAGRIQAVPPDERLSPREGGREGVSYDAGKPAWRVVGYYQKYDRKWAGNHHKLEQLRETLGGLGCLMGNLGLSSRVHFAVLFY